jgi:Flp pilus assembly protein TadG
MSRSKSINPGRLRFRHCRRGIATLEFALVGATLIILILATIEISRFMAIRTSLRAAVSDISRVALVNPSLSSADAKTRALTRTPFLRSSLLTMTVAVTRNAAGTPEIVQVSASYSFTFVVPVFGAPNRTLSASVTTPY